MKKINYCKIDGCNTKCFGKGFCQKHYKRLYGVPETPEQMLWSNMKKRCYNIKCSDYKKYGARGIIICNEWLHNFKSFHNYIGDRPTPEYSLDRIDNNGNYEPGNVRWATKHQQMANTRRNNKVVGVSLHKQTGFWRARLTINKICVFQKLCRYYDDAIKARKKAEKMYLIKI